MTQRIRYKQRKRNKDEYESVQRLQSQTTGAYYKAIINPSNATYKVVNTLRGEIIREGGEKINNIEVLKRAVKRELMDLGVNFEPEIRPGRREANKRRAEVAKRRRDQTTLDSSSQSGLSSEGETERS